ncbi:MAG: VOC family protein [Pseudomonadota bacterium]
MAQNIALTALVVEDYDEALAFYVGRLGFELIEDRYVPEQDKRWVVVSPAGSKGGGLLLALAEDREQKTRVGNQTGGRVFLFLHTDNFWRDYEYYQSLGVAFLETPRQEPYGTVAVFEDLYGNRWDLLEPCD